MANEKYQHIILQKNPYQIKYTSTQSFGARLRIPSRNRREHYDYLRSKLDEAWKTATEKQAVSHSTQTGIYLEFVSDPDADLITKSLEDLKSKKVRLLNVSKRATGIDPLSNEPIVTTFATVFVSHSMREHFLKKLVEYSEKDIDGKPKNSNLINSINDIRNACISSFWRDELSLIPKSERVWCEIWLREDSNSSVEKFDNLLAIKNILSVDGCLHFPERAVKVVLVNYEQLGILIEESDAIAEFRLAKETPIFFLDIPNKEQIDWVKDILSRLAVANSSTSICILDTGINNGHPLIEPFLSSSNMHSVNSKWGVSDHHSHGTLMAGIATYGNLIETLLTNGQIFVNHTLESVKIMPLPPDSNPIELWGFTTSQGIYLAEIQAPEKNRIICSAISSYDTRDRGRPTSWSGAIDQLTSGSEDNKKRLIILCAGNIDMKFAHNYPEAQQSDSIHDPAQAWNAITVGAYTDLVSINDPYLDGFRALAPQGGLSPFTTTSLTWEDKWPIKPDIIMEGGNMAINEAGQATQCDTLSVLSTHFRPLERQFASFNMTSAATAQAAWFASQIQTHYPSLWAETVRGLMVHSAEWPLTLVNEYILNGSKSEYRYLLRACGYGVPNLNKALYSATNSLTMIIQQELQPFIKDKGGIKTNDMHCYDLPWPKETLQLLPGLTPVRMRVTLSYFIEPGPGEIGWKDRYRYASHGLRFDVKSPTETQNEFIRRINIAARTDDENNHSQSVASHWVIGANIRNKGSIHSDIWKGTAAELADSNVIAIFPCSGWWKERGYLNKWSNKARYSLLVSIETPQQDIDLYTPIINQIGIQIPIRI